MVIAQDPGTRTVARPTRMTWEGSFALLISHGSRLVAQVAAACIFLQATFVHGHDWQFTFDARGNLAAQSAETSAPPQILTQPQPQVVVPGALASFFVVAANTRSLTYQWRFNGADISG